jgi:pilus assembly protein CpaE
MQAGRGTHRKGAVGSELPGVVQRSLEEVPNHGRPLGKLVAVLSAGGGSGATSIAINLGVEAAERSDEPCLLVDLDLAYGSIATLLGVESRYGVHDVLAQGGPFDPELVRSTTTVHSEALHLLVSPVSVDFSTPPPISFANLEAALGAMKRAYGFTVVDAPRVSMDVAATLVGVCDLALIVFQQEVVDVRTVSSMIAALGARNVPQEKLVAIANRFHKRGSMLPLADVRSTGGSRILTVRNDYEGALRSINYGQPRRKSPRVP